MQKTQYKLKFKEVIVDRCKKKQIKKVENFSNLVKERVTEVHEAQSPNQDEPT